MEAKDPRLSPTWTLNRIGSNYWLLGSPGSCNQQYGRTSTCAGARGWSSFAPCDWPSSRSLRKEHHTAATHKSAPRDRTRWRTQERASRRDTHTHTHRQARRRAYPSSVASSQKHTPCDKHSTNDCGQKSQPELSAVLRVLFGTKFCNRHCLSESRFRTV